MDPILILVEHLFDFVPFRRFVIDTLTHTHIYIFICIKQEVYQFMIPLYLGIYRYNHNFITKQRHKIISAIGSDRPQTSDSVEISSV